RAWSAVLPEAAPALHRVKSCPRRRQRPEHIREVRPTGYKATRSDIRLIAGDSREPRGSRPAKNAIDKRAMATDIKRIGSRLLGREGRFDILRATGGSIRFSDWAAGVPRIPIVGFPCCACASSGGQITQTTPVP